MTPAAAADALRDARSAGRLLEPFTDAAPDLDEAWGYDVQALDRAHRLAAGEVVAGAKLGLTSRAKQERMGVARPVVGFLTSAMTLPATEVPARIGSWVQPRVEPEIAFTLARPLSGAVTLAEVPGFVEAVHVAVEVLDSRYAGYRFRLADVLADNTSAAAYVLGPAVERDPATLSDLACEVEVDGAVVHRAHGSAILGDPLRSLVLLSEHLARRGETLPAGSVVLAGALTDAVPLEPGSRYRLAIEALGSVVLGA